MHTAYVASCAFDSNKSLYAFHNFRFPIVSKMESCSAVEREIDKVNSKFNSLNKSIDKSVDEQIKQLGNFYGLIGPRSDLGSVPILFREAVTKKNFFS